MSYRLGFLLAVTVMFVFGAGKSEAACRSGAGANRGVAGTLAFGGTVFLFQSYELL